MKALIVYWTKTGHTARAAEDIAEGIKSAGVEVELVDLRTRGVVDLTSHDIIVVGSPCHAGSIKFAATGMSPAILKFLVNIQKGALANKRAAAFSVHSAMGGDRTVASIEKMLRDLRALVVSPGPVVKAGVPFSIMEGPQASEADREKLRAFGKRLATEAHAPKETPE